MGKIITPNCDGYPDVGRGLAPAENKLNIYGKIIEKTLLEIPNKYNNVIIDKYVIMPNHIHAILIIKTETAGASPRPTLNDIICTFKSIATRVCNQQDGLSGRKIFQSSYYEHIIRNQKSYQEIWKYIDDNPLKWQLDELYVY